MIHQILRTRALLIIFFFLPIVAAAQSAATATPPTTVEGWAERLTRFGKAIPQEKVYVHMDNTCYFLGDTIWYAAYTRRTDKDLPSGISRVLYAELYNQDGYLVERQLVEMKGGRGNGCFALPDTLYSGYYELRAYTRWQLNWGQTQHPHTKYAEEWFFSRAMAREYYRDYDKLYSRVFPVYDHPKKAGEYYHDMTVRPLRRNYKEDQEGKDVVIALYPEGGRLVGGAECRVAFEATDDRGMWLEGTMQLRDKDGQTICEAPVVNRGRGLLTFTPLPGAKYEAFFTAKDGRTARATVNRVAADGVALSVQRQADAFQVKVQAQGEAGSRELGLTIMREGVVEEFRPVQNGSANEFANLPIGIHQATVFDSSGRVWADRLFFVTSSSLTRPSLVVDGVKAQYAPFEQASLDVACPAVSPSGTTSLSLAIRDAATQDYTYDNGNILTEMLLSSEIKGFVPQPGYFFERDDDEHRQALDLLMLTQGWRRFDWHTMAAPKAFAISHPAETQTPILTGVVHNYTAHLGEDELRDAALAEHQRFMEEGTGEDSGEDSGDGAPMEEGGFNNDEVFQAAVESSKHDIIRKTQYAANGELASSRYFEDEGRLKREVRVHAEFVQEGSQGIIGDADTQKGRFRLQTPYFYGQCVFFLAASDTTKWKDGREPDWVTVNPGEEDLYPDFYVRLSFPYPRFVKPYAFYQTQLAPAPEGITQELDFLNEGTTTMKTVSVSGRRRGLRRFDASKPAFVIDAYQAFNEVADAGLSVAWYQGHSHFINDVARTYIGDMNMNRAYRIEPRYNSHNSSYYHTSGTIDTYNHLTNLDKVYVYTDYAPRREGLSAFSQDNQPTVSIDLRRYEDQSQRVTYRDRRYILQGFNIAEDFYHPNYSNPPAEGRKDYRRTFYWNPDLQLDANGRAHVQFYVGSKPTTIAVDAQGQAADGTLLTN